MKGGWGLRELWESSGPKSRAASCLSACCRVLRRYIPGEREIEMARDTGYCSIPSSPRYFSLRICPSLREERGTSHAFLDQRGRGPSREFLYAPSIVHPSIHPCVYACMHASPLQTLGSFRTLSTRARTLYLPTYRIAPYCWI